MALPTGYASAGAAPKAVLSPTDALTQAQIQRRMALAQLLQQQSMEPVETSGWNSMPVVPRLGLAPGLAKLAQALVGSYGLNKAGDEQAALSQHQYDAQRAAVEQSLGNGTTGGGTGGVPLGLSTNEGMAFLQNDPTAYYKWLAEQKSLTPENRTDVQQGLILGDVGQLRQDERRVKGTQTFQPGTTNIIPGVNQPFVAPDFKSGIQAGYDNVGNPVMGAINGSQVIAQLAGQQTAAQESNKILPNVTLSNGAQVPMFGGQAVAAAQGGGMPGGPSPAPKTFDNTALNQQAADLVNKYGLSQEAADRWIQDQYAKLPGAQVNSNPLPAPVPREPGATGVGQGTLDKALADKRAGNIGELEQDINDKAASAQAKLANNAKIQQLIGSVTTGPLAGRMTEAKNLLHSLGWTGADPTNNQEFEKYAMQAALESAKQVYGNRITNADLMSLPHWNPSATMTENALRAIVDSDNIKQNRLLQRQNVYNAYKSAGGDLNQFPAYYNTNYPDQGIKASTSLAPETQVQPAAKTVRRYNPATGALE